SPLQGSCDELSVRAIYYCLKDSSDWTGLPTQARQNLGGTSEATPRRFHLIDCSRRCAMARFNSSLIRTSELSQTREPHRLSLLVASEQPAVLTQVVALAEHEFDVQTANTPGAALQMMSGQEFDLLLVDGAMSPMSGLQLLEWGQRHSPRT